jgi:HEAT repeat protein
LNQTLDGDLEYEGHRLRVWLANLDAADTEVRELAASALYVIAFRCHVHGKPIPPAMIEPLVDALRDPQSRVRGMAARALGAVDEAARHALPQLIELLTGDDEEDDARVRIAAAVTELGGAREVAPVLVRLLRDGSDEVREAAGAALEKVNLSGLGVEDQLRDCLTDESPVVRTLACWSHWRLTREADNLVPLLLVALQDERARMDAARLLCWMKEQAEPALPQLLALRDDPNWGVRLQAVRAITHIPCDDELALPVLEALRDDPDEVVRLHVAEELMKRGLAEPAAPDVT